MSTSLLRSFLDCPLDAWLQGNDGSTCPPQVAPRVLALARSAVRDITAYATVCAFAPASWEEYQATWPFLGGCRGLKTGDLLE